MQEKRGEGTAARTVEANRMQSRFVALDLEGMLDEDHQARAVWAYVERLDLTAFYDRIGAREGTPGRPAIDPRILLALWIEATLDGVGSAREIERLSEQHVAYQWICGGVHVNHHTLSDFRNLSSDLLNGLLTQSVALLMAAGVAELRRVAQDGMKVRASAGASSFRTGSRLKVFRKIAREQVERLAEEINTDTGAGNKRQESARKRAAESRARRIERALKELNNAEERKRSNNGKKKTAPRSSTTDPEARVMKMADGGFRPAFNVHLVSDTKSKVILAVQVNTEADSRTMVPLAEQIENRYGVRPKQWLADGGCSSLGNIDKMTQRGQKIYSPLRVRQRKDRKPADPLPTDSAAVREWRKRMSTKAAKKIYRARGATAELVNAWFRRQGLWQFLVRGTQKALSVVLLHALTSNMQRAWNPA